MTIARPPPSAVVKRSVMIAGHRTSVSLEEAFWVALKALAASAGQSVNALAAAVDRDRGAANLSSALRVHVLEQVSAARSRPVQDAAEKARSLAASEPVSATSSSR